MRTDRPRIFISGPISNRETFPREVTNRFVVEAIQITARLILAGYTVFCPHLTWFINHQHRIPYDVWLEVNMPWIKVSDAVLRLPGDSYGRDLECNFAIDCGIPIFHSEEDVLANVPL